MSAAVKFDGPGRPHRALAPGFNDRAPAAPRPHYSLINVRCPYCNKIAMALSVGSAPDVHFVVHCHRCKTQFDEKTAKLDA